MAETTTTGTGIGAPSIAAGGSVIAIACIVVALRVYTRIVTRLGLGWDDGLVAFAVLTTIGTAALILAGNSANPHGNPASAGVDAGYVFTAADQLYMQLGFAAAVVYFSTAGALKLGILLTYRRIFDVCDGFRRQVAVVSGLAVAHWVGCTGAILLTCRPLAYIWGDGGTSGFPDHCFNFNIFWMAANVAEVVLDLVILALPIRVVWGIISLAPRRKGSVLGLFALGGMVIVTGICKILFAYNPHGHIPRYGPAEVWATLHTGLAVVCACLPVLKPLVTDFPRSSRARSTLPGSHRHDGNGWNVIHLDVSSKTGSSRRAYDTSVASPVSDTFTV